MEIVNLSYKGRNVRVFSHHGSDLLSKFYGETEKNIRDLFLKAREAQPSLIIFDEFDSLVPVCSSKQMQIHSSIVSTFLSVMDGTHDIGQVFIIATTNRADRIDPALRRPGRFEKEIQIQPLSRDGRVKAFRSLTRPWMFGHKAEFSEEFGDKFVMERCHGFNWSQLRALCMEAVYLAMRRHCTSFDSISKHSLSRLKVFEHDLEGAVVIVSPTTERSRSSGTIDLSVHQALIERVTSRLRSFFGSCEAPESTSGLGLVTNFLLLHGTRQSCQNVLADYIVHSLMDQFCESVYVVSCDVQELLAGPTSSKNFEQVASFSTHDVFFREWSSKLKQFREANLTPSQKSSLNDSSKPSGRILIIKNFELLFSSLDKIGQNAVACELLDLPCQLQCRSSKYREHCLVIVTCDEVWNASFSLKWEVPFALFKIFQPQNRILCGFK
eukprot:TRINITY_DN39275_c0_g1_i4.p1 TRINITY_DN39275_c0_g1~~TRINITY_DN39275_c0_g1_i4.p1  ORF type:complete len:440 (+),score=94.17 TRINITY_DN39275_c0_g1_i4:423-1742(+)